MELDKTIIVWECLDFAILNYLIIWLLTQPFLPAIKLSLIATTNKAKISNNLINKLNLSFKK